MSNPTFSYNLGCHLQVVVYYKNVWYSKNFIKLFINVLIFIVQNLNKTDALPIYGLLYPQNNSKYFL